MTRVTIEDLREFVHRAEQLRVDSDFLTPVPSDAFWSPARRPGPPFIVAKAR